MDRTYRLVRTSACRVVLGSDTESLLPALLRELQVEQVILIHDAALANLAARLAAACGAKASLAVAGGEACKRLDQVGLLASALREAGAARGTALVALGGGTITDLVGFLAATYMRGLTCVLCPTTTLALCDAALGGKNGVDHAGLKNLLGSIRQPDLILADLSWLESLPQELFCEGLVEVVKKASVLDASAFARLELLAPHLLARQPAALAEALELAVALKLSVVLADELESDRRRWLNFGHTIGHAIESLAEDRIRHGRAVAMGLVAECRAAAEVVPARVRLRIERLLETLGVSSAIPREYADAARLWKLASMDKKVRHGSVPMIVPVELGQGAVVELTAAKLARALQ